MIRNTLIFVSQVQPWRSSEARVRRDFFMPMKMFDAIVVGTGAGGGTAMKILCEAGLQVCAINSGPRTNPATDYRRHRQA